MAWRQEPYGVAEDLAARVRRYPQLQLRPEFRSVTFHLAAYELFEAAARFPRPGIPRPRQGRSIGPGPPEPSGYHGPPERLPYTQAAWNGRRELEQVFLRANRHGIRWSGLRGSRGPRIRRLARQTQGLA